MSEAAETMIALFGTILICAIFMMLTVVMGGMIVLIWQDMKRRM